MTLHHGDCLDVMAQMEPESVDAIVTDPPYGLEFMGKEWDRLWHTAEAQTDQRKGDYSWFGARRPSYGDKPEVMQAWHQDWAEAAYRVAKPSAYLLAFGGTRTFHRLACAIEDAGWIIRDTLVWGYASGFPKSKASLKPAWEPIVMARKPGPLRDLAIDACRIEPQPGDYGHPGNDNRTPGASKYGGYAVEGRQVEPHPAGRWPANIVLTDPIFDGGWEGVVGGGETAVAPNVPWSAQHGDAALFGISGHGAHYGDSGTYSRFFQLPRGATCDWCGASSAELSSFPPSGPDASAPSRAATAASDESITRTDSPITSGTESASSSSGSETTTRTRSWPGSQPDVPSLSDDPANNAARFGTSSVIIPITASLRLCSSCAADVMRSSTDEPEFGASPKWFLIPKADRADREPVLGGLPERAASNRAMSGTPFGAWQCGCGRQYAASLESCPRCGATEREPYVVGRGQRQNVHPTVKPTDLMRHLVRLVTPAGGVVLDPFLGSGTTALAAEMEGFEWIGIEKEAEYVAIAEARLNGVQKGLGLSA